MREEIYTGDRVLIQDIGVEGIVQMREDGKYYIEDEHGKLHEREYKELILISSQLEELG